MMVHSRMVATQVVPTTTKMVPEQRHLMTVGVVMILFANLNGGVQRAKACHKHCGAQRNQAGQYPH